MLYYSEEKRDILLNSAESEKFITKCEFIVLTTDTFHSKIVSNENNKQSGVKYEKSI